MDIDDPNIHQRLDQQGMDGLIAGLSQQCHLAWKQGLAFPLPDAFHKTRRIVVLGMGGSAIGGDLASDLQALEGGAPVVVSREYDLPALADREALVVASSYSGNTEETLSAFEQALATGAQTLALTSGGRLAKLAADHGAPVFPIEFKGQPRAAVGFSLFPLLAIIQRLGLGPDRSDDVTEAIAQIKQLNHTLQPSVPSQRNPAKALAHAIGNRITVVYGAQHLTAAARRWKTQIAENSESWAFAEALPELQHNAIQGFRLPEQGHEQLFVVLLRGSRYNQPIAARCDLTLEALTAAGIPHEAVTTAGAGALSQTITAVLFGDYLSYYLALARNVDPTPVPTLDWVKERMTRS